jgi:hypothetical protein
MPTVNIYTYVNTQEELIGIIDDLKKPPGQRTHE